MPRTRKTPRKERKKPVKIQFHPRPAGRKRDQACPYSLIDARIKASRDDLADARVAVAWLLDVKADKDGHLLLGRCRKATDLDREFRDFDIVILLNAKAWKMLDAKQRAALIHHELCHAALATDPKTGDPVLDERDRKCYRLRRHDLEEFHAVVKEHGLYLGDVATFVQAAVSAPLFAQQTAAELNGAGVGVGSGDGDEDDNGEEK